MINKKSPKSSAELNIKRMLIVIGCSTAVVAIMAAVLLYNGIVHFNHINRSRYPIVGVDVSSYQGEIDWNELSSQDINFAYIKATEGSGFVDEHFKSNWENASKTNLRIGAYHFFSFETTGKEQAENFCTVVPKTDDMLPPVIDVEYYGRFKTKDNINISAVVGNLLEMVDILETEYGKKPIIYVSKETYETIICDDFSECKLWYRSVYSKVPADVDWTIWQYSNRTKLRGYHGIEKFIDMNVFRGSMEEFNSL
ncbi:MAG: glycoside hydrolase family 25 [Butyrivibrio sp.]|nr:glycoside hydrolase family 25 [Butyrivibrio sp.]